MLKNGLNQPHPTENTIQNAFQLTADTILHDMTASEDIDKVNVLNNFFSDQNFVNNEN